MAFPPIVFEQVRFKILKPSISATGYKKANLRIPSRKALLGT